MCETRSIREDRYSQIEDEDVCIYSNTPNIVMEELGSNVPLKCSDPERCVYLVFRKHVQPSSTFVVAKHSVMYVRGIAVRVNSCGHWQNYVRSALNVVLYTCTVVVGEITVGRVSSGI